MEKVAVRYAKRLHQPTTTICFFVNQADVDARRKLSTVAAKIEAFIPGKLIVVSANLCHTPVFVLRLSTPLWYTSRG